MYPEIKPLSPELESLRQNLQEKGVKYAMASFVDLHGMCKGKVVPKTQEWEEYNYHVSDWQLQRYLKFF